MRQFTRLFKAMLELGLEPKQHVIAMWVTVKTGALADKAPAVVQAVAFIDRIISVVADLPKPEADEQTEILKTGEGTTTAARETDLHEGNRG